MPYIRLKNVSLDYPVYDVASRSFRRTLIKALPVGGKIQTRSGNRRSVLALDKVSLNLEEGDRVALLGNNGAGKTSFLKLLAGFYEPSSGDFQREGKVSALLSLMSGMDANLNGYENIVLCGMLYGLNRKEALAKVGDIVEFCGLGDYLEMPVRMYSSGMMVRLAFSICTSIDSEILLLDEWVGAGDEAFIKKTRERLNEMVFRSAILVFATHSPMVARELCSKAIYLANGELRFFGGIEEALQMYSTDQVSG